MANPLGVLMLLPMIASTLAPFKEALMMLGACSFQLVQNIILSWEETREKHIDAQWALLKMCWI